MDLTERETPSLEIAMTPRQRECIELVRAGLSSKEIARKLGISHRTVEAHVKAVMDLLEVNSRMAAVFKLEALEKTGSGLEDRQPDEGIMLQGKPAVDDSYLIAPRDYREVKGYAPTIHSILPPFGGRPNTVPAAIRRIWIVRIAIISTMLTCLVILSILGFSELASGT
jgi:DNA-binding CsgD family transcriptional regulator